MQCEGESIGWSLTFEVVPAAIFGSAVAFATSTIFGDPAFSMTPAAAGAAAFGCIWLALGKIGSQPKAYPIAAFERPPLECELSAVSELLEQADVVGIVEQLGASGEDQPAEELLLDHALVEPEPDSRVVRLFDPNETAGEMQARIEDHLRSAPRQDPPDATQELHDALAALRRSLR